MSWKAGDVAIIDVADSRKDLANLQGQKVRLVKFLGPMEPYPHKDYWALEGACFAREACLRKPYDGHDKCSWEDCIWEPDLVGIKVTERV